MFFITFAFFFNSFNDLLSYFMSSVVSILFNHVRMINPFNSQKWLTRNFSLWYLEQTVNENTKTYQEEILILILHQILTNNFQGIV